MTSTLTQTIRVPMRMPNYWRLHVEPWRDGFWRFACDGGGDGFVYGNPIDPNVSCCTTRQEAEEFAAIWSLAFWRARAQEAVGFSQTASRHTGVKAIERYCEKHKIPTGHLSDPQPQENDDMAKSATAVKEPKSRKPQLEQTRIDGTYDEPPRAVKKKADEYVQALLEESRSKGTKHTVEGQLIALMHEHGLEQVDLNNGFRIKIKLAESIQKKKIPKPKSPDDEDDSDD